MRAAGITAMNRCDAPACGPPSSCAHSHLFLINPGFAGITLFDVESLYFGCSRKVQGEAIAGRSDEDSGNRRRRVYRRDGGTTSAGRRGPGDDLRQPVPQQAGGGGCGRGVRRGRSGRPGAAGEDVEGWAVRWSDALCRADRGGREHAAAGDLFQQQYGGDADAAGGDAGDGAGPAGVQLDGGVLRRAGDDADPGGREAGSRPTRTARAS